MEEQMVKKDSIYDWYLYLILFENHAEFKLGKGKGLDNLARIKCHHSRKAIDLKESYLISGSEKSISKLESILKNDYSTDDYILSEEEIKLKYPGFLRDGYTEIRRKACLDLMLEHIRFKKSRPGIELSELKKGIEIPKKESNKKLFKKKSARSNESILRDISEQILVHKKYLLEQIKSMAEIKKIGTYSFQIKGNNNIGLDSFAQYHHRNGTIHYSEVRENGHHLLNLGLTETAFNERNMMLYFNYSLVKNVVNSDVAKEIEQIVKYLSKYSG